MKILYSAVISLLICLACSEKGIAQNEGTKNRQNIPVIDKEKHYPEKVLDPKVEISYIQLETNKDVLLDQDAHVYYVSDNRMLITNGLKGDVFIFGMDGKAISHFNEKGGTGYAQLKYALYDEPNREVFIVDDIRDKIVVFTENGAIKRTLHLPGVLNITEIYNFDANTLLAFHEYMYGPLEQNQPYLFISKKDGRIVSKLNITTNKANPRHLKTGSVESGVIYTVKHNRSGSCKFGKEFILANMSCDTIYLLKQDKTLTPLFVQTPTVFSDPPIVTYVGMKTDDFMTFYVYPYNLKKVRREYESGTKQNGSNDGSKFLMYEFKTRQFFELENTKYWAEMVDVPANTSVELLSPYIMKIWLQRGYLKGELKKIATKVNANDNPVVKIAKFK